MSEGSWRDEGRWRGIGMGDVSVQEASDLLFTLADLGWRAMVRLNGRFGHLDDEMNDQLSDSRDQIFNIESLLSFAGPRSRRNYHGDKAKNRNARRFAPFSLADGCSLANLH